MASSQDDFDDDQEVGMGDQTSLDKKKRYFSKELRCMMFGFGDDQNPYTESVDLLEDLVIKFITESRTSGDGYWTFWKGDCRGCGE